MTAEATHSSSNLNDNNRHKYATRNLWTGILFGLGLVAFIDEAVFVQYCIVRI
jgi:uncharacterized membrane protein